MRWSDRSGGRQMSGGSRRRLTLGLLGLANGVGQRARLASDEGPVTVDYQRSGDRLTFTLDGPASRVRVQLAFGQVERIDNGRLLFGHRGSTVEWGDVARPLVVTLWH
jgi:hypothetical protein